MNKVVEWAKSHWKMIAIVVAVLVVGYVLIQNLAGGSASTSTSSDNPAVDEINAQANAALALNAQQDSAALSAAQLQANGQATTTAAQLQLGEDTLAAQTATNTENNNATVALTEYTTAANQQLQEYGLQIQQAINANNNATVLGSQTIAANENVAVGQQEVGLLTTESNNNLAANENLTSAAVQIQGIKSGSSFFGGVFKDLFG